MTTPKNSLSQKEKQRIPPGMSPERYARLMAEAKAPYKGLRKFMYGAFGASGAIGGFVFFAQVLSGRDLEHALPNLALQLGVVALMVFLFRLESRKAS
ncbi:MAG: DUF3493 domain-containing protein [Leptolyngbyaceae cyanobacterium]